MMQELGNQDLDLSFPEIFFKGFRWGQESRYVKCFCYSRIRNLPKLPTPLEKKQVGSSNNSEYRTRPHFCRLSVFVKFFKLPQE